MPIKKENKHLYPSNWKEISKGIIKRDNNKCVNCYVSNYAFVDSERNIVNKKYVYKSVNDNKYYAFVPNITRSYMIKRVTKIVLTVHHKDENPQNNDSDNLESLCQKCHLANHRKVKNETNRM